MNAKSFILTSFVCLSAIYSYGQIEQDSISTAQEVENPIEQKAEIQQLEVPIYKLFPTTNYWCFIKLDTRNGKMWQVHFTLSEEGYQGELILNSRSLVWDKEINGRFTLYPTENMFNFILLDQFEGTTYQVQWNNDEDLRFVSRIY
ncbi:MAG: hypothetical protein AB8B53_01465 [Flavobacteriales bacterium]